MQDDLARDHPDADPAQALRTVITLVQARAIAADAGELVAAPAA